MKILKNLTLLVTFLFLLTNCQTVKDKTDQIVKKENEKLSTFIGKPVSVLKIELGNPNEDYLDESGNKILVFKTKKYGIPCERKFEINEAEIVIGFVSKGCF